MPVKLEYLIQIKKNNSLNISEKVELIDRINEIRINLPSIQTSIPVINEFNTTTIRAESSITNISKVYSIYVYIFEFFFKLFILIGQRNKSQKYNKFVNSMGFNLLKNFINY